MSMIPNRREMLAVGAALAFAPTTGCAASSDGIDLSAGGTVRLRGGRPVGTPGLDLAASAEPGVTIVSLTGGDGRMLAANGELGVQFDAMPGLEMGVQLWRYAPWKAWTRPLAVARPADLREDDVQLLYWRERDGSFAAAVPLSGAGFRTTLGQVDGRLAARAMAGATAAVPKTLVVMAVGHGDDPHAVIAATYRAALTAMGRADSGAATKRLPEPLRYLGWNSWNASNLGKNLDEKLLLDAAQELRGAGVAVGWMLVDDGYFDHREQRLRGFAPDAAKFPQGFAPLIARLKRDHGIRHVGAWLALDGYWHGIDPASPLGEAYRTDLFTWREPSDASNPTSTPRTNSFVRPDRPAMARFYDAHLAALRAAGFDFIKVDNQLVVERMARGNFPVWTLATAMHQGMNAAAGRHFGNAMINCMDLTADAYFNLGTTPVARAVEDYFPYKSDESYDLEKGNAAAHVLQALYNALYMSQVAIPDFDMFETTNPNARLHAVARAANNGPIYVTDLPGQHDVALLRSMTLADGRSLRADTPLLPCRDCLFQLQDKVPFKAWSRVGDAGLLAIFNLADADRVTGRFGGGDVPGFEDRAVVAYEHLTGRMTHIAPGETIATTLPRLGTELWSLHDAATNFAAFGRSDKINGVATVTTIRKAPSGYEVDLAELGPFAAYAARRPASVRISRKPVPFTWEAGLLRIAAGETAAPATITIGMTA